MHPLHQKAIEIGKTYFSCEGMLLETLIQMVEEHLFLKLHYSGMWEFLERELHMSDCQAGYFSRVASKAIAVPELRRAVASGELSISKARRIVGVINPENSLEWIEAAKSLKQRQLERKISEESPRRKVFEGIVPLSEELSKLTVVISVEEEERLERVKDLVTQSQQKPASYQEAVVTAIDLYLEKKDPVQKAERALRTSIPRKVGKKRYGKRAPIPAHIKHKVHARDGFRCTSVDKDGNRCKREGLLQLHHIILVSQNGPNTVENLTTRCYWHHKIEHIHDAFDHH